ncbi:hypothetical protein EWM64_g4481 [Hericium alpestre]|uniref:cellulase n=1 Tax=Hericium alpestre TaxID=135208 RepID=A0A4Y9ZZB4_9AGAM|nr:hypothetical protein EWM64_g4481 [Hericium alpestre]
MSRPPSTGKYIHSADGTTVYAEASGSHLNPHIVLIPGLGLSGAVFDEFCTDERLFKSVYAVRVDPRGQGRSSPATTAESHLSRHYAEDFEAIVKAFDLHKPILVAWSLGGAFLCDIATYLPSFTLSGCVFLAGMSWAQELLQEVGRPEVLVPSPASHRTTRESRALRCAAGSRKIRSMNVRRFSARVQHREKLRVAGEEGLPLLHVYGTKDGHQKWWVTLDYLKPWFRDTEVHAIEVTLHFVVCSHDDCTKDVSYPCIFHVTVQGIPWHAKSVTETRGIYMAFKKIGALGIVGLSALSVRAQAAVYAQCGGIVGLDGRHNLRFRISLHRAERLLLAMSSRNRNHQRALRPSYPPTSAPITSDPPTTTKTTPTSTAPSGPAPSGKLKFAGVNISGFDFGCSTAGDCHASAAWPPLTQYYGMDGAGQMQHFVEDDGYNVFRLPVGWQYLVGDTLGGPIVDANMAEYDALVQTCLATGASCIIDIHNYARWNNEIIGQGGPTNEQFAALWSAIAAKYADEPKIIFGVMNEPHDIPDINLWADSVQAAVTAIRNAGATQLILLPGNDYTSAAQFISNGSAAALSKVVNPDGGIDNLVFDVHKYLDSDNSGTHPDCTTNNIDEAWAPLVTYLRENGRQAFNTETGGGNVASCVTYMNQQIAYQAANTDVILGYVGWAAGNFDPSYVLGEAPTKSGNTWTDTLLVAEAMSPATNGLVA